MSLFDADTIADAVGGVAQQFGARRAVCYGPSSLTFDELHGQSAAVASWLAEHVPEGPVLYLPRNGLPTVPQILGAINSGRRPLFGDPAWAPAEVRRILVACDARALLWAGELPASPAFGCLRRLSSAQGLTLYQVSLPPGERRETNLLPACAFGRFTSGSTGLPRCLQFSGRAALSAARGWQQATELGGADVVLCLAALHNGLAFNTSLLSVLLAGGTLAFHAGRLLPGSIAKTLATVRPTVLTAFPMAYELLARRPEVVETAAQGLRLAVSSAAPLDAEVGARFAAAGLPICDYYGLAEVGPCTFNDGREPGTVGRALPGVELRVVSEEGDALAAGAAGRVRVRTPSMAADYLDVESPRFDERVDESGAYVTQDRGILSGSGRLRLLGRIGRLVNVAGRKVDPSEIEGVLRQLDGVDAVVVRGEEAVGRVVLAAYIENHDERLQRAGVVSHCRAHLAQYKVPQSIVIVPQFPRSSAGKVFLERFHQAPGGA